MFLPNCTNRRCKGVNGVLDSLRNRLAILPISVCIPTAVTTARPCPLTIVVPRYTIVIRSPKSMLLSDSNVAFASFSTGKLSPVRADSSACSSTDSIKRASAAMALPFWTTKTSPKTTSSASICTI